MKRHSHLSMKKLSLAIALGLIHAASYAAEPTLQDTQSAETTQSNVAIIEIVSDGKTYTTMVDFSDPVSVKQAIDSLIQQAGADSSDAIIQQFTQQAQSLAQSEGLTLISPSIDGQAIPLLVDSNNQAQINLVATQLNSLGLDNSSIKSLLTSAGINTKPIDAPLNTADSQPDIGDVKPSAGQSQPLGAQIDVNLSAPAAGTISELQVVNDQFDVSPR